MYKYDIHSAPYCNNIFREKRKKPNKNFNLGKSDLNQHHNQKRETPLIRWWIHVWYSSLYIFLYDNIDVNTWITRDLWEKSLDKFRIVEFSALRFANSYNLVFTAKGYYFILSETQLTVLACIILHITKVPLSILLCPFVLFRLRSLRISVIKNENNCWLMPKILIIFLSPCLYIKILNITDGS